MGLLGKRGELESFCWCPHSALRPDLSLAVPHRDISAHSIPAARGAAAVWFSPEIAACLLCVLQQNDPHVPSPGLAFLLLPHSPAFPAHLATKPSVSFPCHQWHSLPMQPHTAVPSMPVCSAVLTDCAPPLLSPHGSDRALQDEALCHSCCFSFHVPCPFVLSLCLTLGLKSLVDTRQHPASPSSGLCLFHFSPIPRRSVQHLAAPCSSPCPQCPGPGSLLAARGSHCCSPHSLLLPPLPCRFAVGPYSGCAPSGRLSPPLGATDPPPGVASLPAPSLGCGCCTTTLCLVLGTSIQSLLTNHSLGTWCSLAAASQELGVPMRPGGA